jgi:hypothetical protein
MSGSRNFVDFDPIGGALRPQVLQFRDENRLPDGGFREKEACRTGPEKHSHPAAEIRVERLLKP